MRDELWTLKETADFFKVKSRTVVEYGKQGRIIIRGTRNGQKVLRSSIDAYLEGRSAWHARQGQSGESQTPAAFATAPSAPPPRGKPSGDAPTAAGTIIAFRADRTLKHG